MSADSRAPDKTLVTTRDFLRAGLIAPARRDEIDQVLRVYAAAMSPHLVGLVDPADPADPIARQFTPDPRELVRAPHERDDPIGDRAHAPLPGLVHRYRDRVLLQLLTVCPVYCRFCFRRETVGATKGGLLSQRQIEEALAYIRARPQIWEVILTGGDPFTLSARRLRAVVASLAAIDHVQVIRVHTRAPAAAPHYVTPARIAALATDLATVYVAIHANHPRELTGPAHSACAQLSASGLPLLGQTVLLRGVNDDVDTLETLMRAFVARRIKPYYLHHPDLAPGTAHFRMPIAEGRMLYEALCARLSGLARPNYVLDIPGGAGKVALAGERAEHLGAGRWRVTDPNGRKHLYDDDAP